MSISNRLVRTLYPYGSTRRVLRGPARGVRFVVEPGIGFTFAAGSAAAAPRIFAAKLRTGMTVYDVGANKGQSALLFGALVGPTGRVVAFEPAPAEFASLERNLALNAFSQVRAVQAAAADTVGNMTFTYSPERPTQGKLAGVEPLYRNPGAEAIGVRTVPLDDFLAEERPPDLLKIDVEGAAAAVFRGARRILDEIAPAIYVELHGPEEQASIAAELVTRGYRIETPEGREVAEPFREWQSPLWCYRP